MLEISQALPGRPVDLCKSTLHDNLKGTRQTLPRWEWVSTFVRALRTAVTDDELDADQLIGTMEQWRQRYVAAGEILDQQRNTDPGLPLSAPLPLQAAVAGGAGAGAGASHTGERPAGDAPPEDMPDPFGLSAGFITDLQEPRPGGTPDCKADPAPTEGPPSPGELFGDHGVELLSGAVRGDREAQARLGILLLCRGGDPQQALSWLDDAASHGDVMAKSLRRIDPAMRRELAAAYAFEIAQPVDGPPDDSAGQPETPGATVYYEAAAEAGHPGAAYRLGALSEAAGETTQALHWYEMAADYQDAPDRRNRLNRDVRS